MPAPFMTWFCEYTCNQRVGTYWNGEDERRRLNTSVSSFQLSHNVVAPLSNMNLLQLSLEIAAARAAVEETCILGNHWHLSSQCLWRRDRP